MKIISKKDNTKFVEKSFVLKNTIETQVIEKTVYKTKTVYKDKIIEKEVCN
jgi:hypothetical protein